MRKKLLYLIPCFLLWLGIFGASFSFSSFAYGTTSDIPVIYPSGSYYLTSVYYPTIFTAPFVLINEPSGYNNYVRIYTQDNSTFSTGGSVFPSGYGVNASAFPSEYFISPLSNKQIALDALRNYSPSVYDESLLLDPKWAYMSGNGLLILNPSANVASTEITLNNLTTGNSFDYSTGSGHVYINFNQSIASIGDRIQFVMIPKDSAGNYGDTYYLSQTIDLLNLTTTNTYVSKPYVPVPIPEPSGSGNTVVNVPVSGTTSYTVYNYNPVTNVSSQPVIDYVISADYSTTEYNQETIEIINQYILNNYDNSSNTVVNNYVYYETNNNIDIDININSIKQTFNEFKSLGFNLLNFFTNIRGLFTEAFSFLPGWLIALIFGGFVLIIVLVIVKIILLII